MIKGIYLGSAKARHLNYNIVYQDIEKDKYNCDLGGDMLDVDLSNYDYIIATPPCNYWSKVNAYYKTSEYALKTKHLLPCMIKKLSLLDKPFIIENVRNPKRYTENGIYDLINSFSNNYIYFVGRHMYITNIMINLYCKQEYEFRLNKNHRSERISKYCLGGDNVFNVIEYWLKRIHCE